MADKKQTIVIKRITAAAHGGHGGAWKVAYADFVTAMMCFFLVMWLMGADEEKKAEIAHYFNHPNTPWKNGRDPHSETTTPLGERQGAGDSILNGLEGQTPSEMIEKPVRPVPEELEANRRLSEVVTEMMDGKAYAVDANVEYMKFSLPDSAFFEDGKTELSEDAGSFLEKIGELFKGYKGNITIDVHTDNNAKSLGDSSSAFEFGMTRAVALMKYFVNKGTVEDGRIVPTSSGPTRAFTSNSTPEGQAKNRRIEFTLSPKRAL